MKKKVLLAIVMVSLMMSLMPTFQTAGATGSADREKIRMVLNDTAKEIGGTPYIYYGERVANSPTDWPKEQPGFAFHDAFTLWRQWARGVGICSYEELDDRIGISPFGSEELATARFEADYLAHKNLTPFMRKWYESRAAEGASVSPSCEKIQFNGYPGYYSEVVVKGRNKDTYECGQIYNTYFSFTMKWVCGRYIFHVHRDGYSCGLPVSSDPVRDWADVLFRNAQKHGLCVEKGIDSDKDGVPDDKDKCPATPAGVAVDERGCPIGMDLSVSTDEKAYSAGEMMIIQGSVWDAESGQPIEGAKVVIDVEGRGQAWTLKVDEPTDSLGDYRGEFPLPSDIPPGTYTVTITASKSGYPDKSKSTSITIGEPAMWKIFYPDSNKKQHHATHYKGGLVVYRRAQRFTVLVEVSNFNDDDHGIQWAVDGSPLEKFDPSSSGEKWGVEELDLSGSKKSFKVFIPVDAGIGKHTLKAELYEKDTEQPIPGSARDAPEFYVIFNPWPDDGDGFVDDDVYNSAFKAEPAALAHYVEDPKGYNYEGMGKILFMLRRINQKISNAKKAGQPIPQNWLDEQALLQQLANNPDLMRKPWELRPGNKKIFELVMSKVQGMTDAERAMHELTIETTKVIRGCWCYGLKGCPRRQPDGTVTVDPYCGDKGYGPPDMTTKRRIKPVAGWYKVPKMLSVYLSSGKQKRALGQCLDYAGLAAGFARAVGVPARQVTCTLVAHPDYWYHAWTEVWLDNAWHVADGAEGVGVDTRFNSITQDYNISYANHVYTYNAQDGRWCDVLNTY